MSAFIRLIKTSPVAFLLPLPSNPWRNTIKNVDDQSQKVDLHEGNAVAFSKDMLRGNGAEISAEKASDFIRRTGGHARKRNETTKKAISAMKGTDFIRDAVGYTGTENKLPTEIATECITDTGEYKSGDRELSVTNAAGAEESGAEQELTAENVTKITSDTGEYTRKTRGKNGVRRRGWYTTKRKGKVPPAGNATGTEGSMAEQELSAENVTKITSDTGECTRKKKGKVKSGGRPWGGYTTKRKGKVPSGTKTRKAKRKQLNTRLDDSKKGKTEFQQIPNVHASKQVQLEPEEPVSPWRSDIGKTAKLERLLIWASINEKFEFSPTTESEINNKLLIVSDPVRSTKRSSGTCACCGKSLYKFFGKSNLSQIKQCQHLFHSNCLRRQLQSTLGAGGDVECMECKTPYCKGLQHGKMPHGFLTINCNRGHEYIECTYDIPSGIQANYHPQPGKPYESYKTSFFFTNTLEGRRLLTFVARAFLKGCTFEIVDGKLSPPIFEHKFTVESLKEDPEYLERLAAFFLPKPTDSTPNPTNYLERLAEFFARKPKPTEPIPTDSQPNTPDSTPNRANYLQKLAEYFGRNLKRAQPNPSDHQPNPTDSTTT